MGSGDATTGGPITTGFNHVAIGTPDLDRLVGFYGTAFGAVVTFEMPAAPDHPRMAVIDLGGGGSKWGPLSNLPKLRDAMNLPPRRVGSAPVQEVVWRGDEVDLSKIPVLKCWPLDGGPFITLPLVITRDPETGERNMGMYRMQVMSRNTTGMHWQRHKTGTRHLEKAAARGQRLEVAVALGGGWPLLSAVAAFSALKNYRAIGIVLSSCAASFGLGFVVARETTLSYLHTLWHWPETILAALTGSINNTAYAMVARALGGSSTLSWLIMVVVVLAVAHFAAQRAGDRYVAAAFGLCLPALVLPYSTATVWVLLLPLVVLLARWNPIAAAFGAYLLWFEWFPGRLDYIYGGIQGEWWLPPFEVFASAPALYLLVLMLLSLGGKIAQPSTGTLAKK